jgi:hypothetical protein
VDGRVPGSPSVVGDGGWGGRAVPDGFGNSGGVGGWRKDWDEIERGNGAGDVGVVVDRPVASLLTDVAVGVDAAVEFVRGEVFDVGVAVDGVEYEGGLASLAVEAAKGLLVGSLELLLGGLDGCFDFFKVGSDVLLATLGRVLDLRLKVVSALKVLVELENLGLQLLGLVVKVDGHFSALVEGAEVLVPVLGVGGVVVLVAQASGVFTEVGDESEGVADGGKERGGIVALLLSESVLERAVGGTETAVTKGVSGAAGVGGRGARHGGC